MVYRLLFGLVPRGPRAKRFDFRELATGRSMFRREGDVKVRDKALAVPWMVECSIG